MNDEGYSAPQRLTIHGDASGVWGEAADAESEKPSPQFASETAGYDLAWRDDKTLALSGLRLPALSLGAAAAAATLPVVDRAW